MKIQHHFNLIQNVEPKVDDVGAALVCLAYIIANVANVASEELANAIFKGSPP